MPAIPRTPKLSSFEILQRLCKSDATPGVKQACAKNTAPLRLEIVLRQSDNKITLEIVRAAHIVNVAQNHYQ